jgi:hypothetical protein
MFVVILGNMSTSIWYNSILYRQTYDVGL